MTQAKDSLVLTLVQCPWSPQLHPASPSGLQTSHSALADEITLQLREDSTHSEHRSSRGSAGVDSFVETYQLDTKSLKFLPEPRHVRKGAGQSIQTHHHNR